VSAVRQEQTGVATGMNTVMRTLGGAFGATLTTTCITASDRHGLPTDQGFTLAFGVCAAALVIGLLTALAIPEDRRAGAPLAAPHDVSPSAASAS
jgi:hypothetical protein